MPSIEADGVSVEFDWTDENREVRDALADAAPFEGKARLWGDELYFDTPVDVVPEETTTDVDVGTVAYWQEGNALCVFWGPTPASVGDEPRPAEPVARVGHAEDAERLSSVEAGETARFALTDD